MVGNNTNDEFDIVKVSNKRKKESGEVKVRKGVLIEKVCSTLYIDGL